MNQGNMTPQTTHLLSVFLERGRDLKNLDFLTKQDPYCLLRVGQQQEKSLTLKGGGRNPIWNQTFSFYVGPADHVLSIEILDKDFWKKDDYVGFSDVPLAQVRMAGKAKVHVPVFLDRERQQQHGTLLLDMEMFPIQNGKAELTQRQSAATRPRQAAASMPWQPAAATPRQTSGPISQSHSLNLLNVPANSSSLNIPANSTCFTSTDLGLPARVPSYTTVQATHPTAVTHHRQTSSITSDKLYRVAQYSPTQAGGEASLGPASLSTSDTYNRAAKYGPTPAGGVGPHRQQPSWNWDLDSFNSMGSWQLDSAESNLSADSAGQYRTLQLDGLSEPVSVQGLQTQLTRLYSLRDQKREHLLHSQRILQQYANCHDVERRRWYNDMWQDYEATTWELQSLDKEVQAVLSQMHATIAALAPPMHTEHQPVPQQSHLAPCEDPLLPLSPLSPSHCSSQLHRPARQHTPRGPETERNPTSTSFSSQVPETGGDPISTPYPSQVPEREGGSMLTFHSGRLPSTSQSSSHWPYVPLDRSTSSTRQETPRTSHSHSLTEQTSRMEHPRTPDSQHSHRSHFSDTSPHGQLGQLSQPSQVSSRPSRQGLVGGKPSQQSHVSGKPSQQAQPLHYTPLDIYADLAPTRDQHAMPGLQDDDIRALLASSASSGITSNMFSKSSSSHPATASFTSSSGDPTIAPFTSSLGTTNSHLLTSSSGSSLNTSHTLSPTPAPSSKIPTHTSSQAEPKALHTPLDAEATQFKALRAPTTPFPSEQAPHVLHALTNPNFSKPSQALAASQATATPNPSFTSQPPHTSQSSCSPALTCTSPMLHTSRPRISTQRLHASQPAATSELTLISHPPHKATTTIATTLEPSSPFIAYQAAPPHSLPSSQLATGLYERVSPTCSLSPPPSHHHTHSMAGLPLTQQPAPVQPTPPPAPTHPNDPAASLGISTPPAWVLSHSSCPPHSPVPDPFTDKPKSAPTCSSGTHHDSTAMANSSSTAAGGAPSPPTRRFAIGIGSKSTHSRLGSVYGNDATVSHLSSSANSQLSALVSTAPSPAATIPLQSTPTTHHDNPATTHYNNTATVYPTNAAATQPSRAIAPYDTHPLLANPALPAAEATTPLHLPPSWSVDTSRDFLHAELERAAIRWRAIQRWKRFIRFVCVNLFVLKLQNGKLISPPDSPLWSPISITATASLSSLASASNTRLPTPTNGLRQAVTSGVLRGASAPVGGSLAQPPLIGPSNTTGGPATAPPPPPPPMPGHGAAPRGPPVPPPPPPRHKGSSMPHRLNPGPGQPRAHMQQSSLPAGHFPFTSNAAGRNGAGLPGGAVTAVGENAGADAGAGTGQNNEDGGLFRDPQFVNLVRVVRTQPRLPVGERAKAGDPRSIAKNAVTDNINFLEELKRRGGHQQKVEEDVRQYAEMISRLAARVDTNSSKTMDDLCTLVDAANASLDVLVDVPAVLKHFEEWPEKRFDTMQEAVDVYRRLGNKIKALERWQAPSTAQKGVLQCKLLVDDVRHFMDRLAPDRPSMEKRYASHGLPWDVRIYGKVNAAALQLCARQLKLTLEATRSSRPLKEDGLKESVDLLHDTLDMTYRVYQMVGAYNTEVQQLSQEAIQVWKELTSCT